MPAVTPAEKRIPFSRVNHNKYMVTDNTAYIGRPKLNVHVDVENYMYIRFLRVYVDNTQQR